MSILVIEISHHGIVMGADKNLTHSATNGISLGQSQRSKILRLPSNKGLIGYVGAARVGNLFTDEWLQEYIYQNVNFDSLESFANKLASAIQIQRGIDEGEKDAQSIIIHITGFGKTLNNYFPLVYRITNMKWNNILNDYFPATKDFYCDQHILYENGITHQNIRDHYRRGNIGWFHQGFDLGAYNTIDNKLSEAFYLLGSSGHPNHPFINSIKEKELFVKMKVLSYGAYFSSFFLPNEQYVGGGADVLSISWPEDI